MEDGKNRINIRRATENDEGGESRTRNAVSRIGELLKCRNT